MSGVVDYTCPVSLAPNQRAGKFPGSKPKYGHDGAGLEGDDVTNRLLSADIPVVIFASTYSDCVLLY